MATGDAEDTDEAEVTDSNAVTQSQKREREDENDDDEANTQSGKVRREETDLNASMATGDGTEGTPFTLEPGGTDDEANTQSSGKVRREANTGETDLNASMAMADGTEGDPFTLEPGGTDGPQSPTETLRDTTVANPDEPMNVVSQPDSGAGLNRDMQVDPRPRVGNNPSSLQDRYKQTSSQAANRRRQRKGQLKFRVQQRRKASFNRRSRGRDTDNGGPPSASAAASTQLAAQQGTSFPSDPVLRNTSEAATNQAARTTQAAVNPQGVAESAASEIINQDSLGTDELGEMPAAEAAPVAAMGSGEPAVTEQAPST